MKILIPTFLLLCPLLLLNSCGHAPITEAAREDGFAYGVVFHDANRNGIRDRGERGLSGMRVSNGKDVVKTDTSGSYRIAVDEDTIVFLIKPGGWNIPLNRDNLPQFYYIHKPQGSPPLKYAGVKPTGALPPSIEFPLYRAKEPKEFTAIFLGDTQARNQEEIDFVAHDLVEELVTTDAAFGATLGDILFDDLSHYESLNATLAHAGIPWINVIGNHDENYASPNDRYSDETFESFYGPSTFSFDYGPVHFLVLDDVVWDGKEYHGGFTPDQLEFIRNDLALVPKDRLVVAMMHIPLDQTRNKEDLFAILDDRPHTFSISAHWHRQKHWFFGAKDGWHGAKPHHHLVAATTCGSWWGGLPDPVGIPHATMQDGGPKGYTLIDFDENSYSMRFKATRRPDDYQMNIFTPEVVASEKAGLVDVVVNVFIGSERSTVEMRFGGEGEWVPMEPFAGFDPFFTLMHKIESSLNPHPHRLVSEPRETGHLWRTKLPMNPPAGSHLIHIRTTDMFGQIYEARRVIRIQ